jgi:hypothetical protein
MLAIRPRRASAPILLLALLLAGLAVRFATAPPAGARAHASNAAHVPLLGVNAGGVQPRPLPVADSYVSQARALGAKVIRTEVPWSNLEPTGRGIIDPTTLTFMDRLMSRAASAGIKVIMSVSDTPCWASSAPPSLLAKCHPGDANDASDWPPTNPGDYANFVAYLAHRYGPHLAAIEIWNEPDQANELYFAGPEKAARYTAILHAAYPAIKAADPSVTVIAGSLVGSNGVFLSRLYAAGAKGFYDGLAIHYYNLTLASVRAIRAVQLANGDNKPLWLDEFGWTSCYPKQRIEDEQACVTESIQAANLVSSFRALVRYGYLAAIVSYKLQDSTVDNFGVVAHSGARKRSFKALSSIFASPFGALARVHLSLRKRGGSVLASGSAPVGDYLRLEAFKHGALRYKTLFTLNRFNRFSVHLPRLLGTSGLRVRAYELGAPRLGAQRST